MQTSNQTHFLRPWIIWITAAAFYCYEFFLQISPSVMVPDLMRSFNVNAAVLGNLAAFYFYSYTIMQIPSGLFIDRLGPRRVITIACFICAAGAFLFASAQHIVIAQIGRTLIGIGSAFAFIGTAKLLSIWFPLNRFALLVGLTLAIGMSGAVGAGAPLAAMVDHLGWRHSLFILAGVGFILSGLIWFIVRDKCKKNNEDCNAIDESRQQLPIWQGLKSILTRTQNYYVAIYGGLMFAPTSAFAGLWGVSFLMANYGIARPMAGGAISMVFIGWAVGSPLSGIISDALQRRKPTLYGAAIGGFITMTMIIYLHMPITLLYCMLFLFGFLCSGFLPSFSIIHEINRTDTNATAIGFMNTVNMIGGACLQPIIGIILDLNWTGQFSEGTRVYSVADYHHALLVLPVILALALILLPFIKETHCRLSEHDM